MSSALNTKQSFFTVFLNESKGRGDACEPALVSSCWHDASKGEATCSVAVTDPIAYRRCVDGINATLSHRRAPLPRTVAVGCARRFEGACGDGSKQGIVFLSSHLFGFVCSKLSIDGTRISTSTFSSLADTYFCSVSASART